MKAQLKLGLYVVTAVGTLLFGTLFLQSWRRSTADGAVPVKRSSAAAVSAKPGTKSNAVVSGAAASKATQPKGVGGVTNEAGVSTTGTASSPPKKGDGTNAAPAIADDAETNEVAAAAGEVTPENEAVPMRMESGARPGLGRMIICGLLAVVSLVGLGFLSAYDLTSYTASRATQLLFDDRGADVGDTDYEKIEKVYGSGEYLEAVRMLRDFHVANPKAVHAQLRIAEIYEKDLNNPLAAALEYEEVLKRPLEPNRRGWAAIHLVNLYNRLDRGTQAVALMQRICIECPETPAAAKARERLEALGEEIPQAPASGAGDVDPSGLPPGFRRKR